jgi:hypothetical protein
LAALSAVAFLLLLSATKFFYKEPKLQNYFETSHNFDIAQSRVGYNPFAKTTESLITSSTTIITTTTPKTIDTTSATPLTSTSDLRRSILINFCNGRLGNQVRLFMISLSVFKKNHFKVWE